MPVTGSTSGDSVKLVTLPLCTEAIFNETILTDLSILKHLHRKNNSLFFIYPVKHHIFHRFDWYADAFFTVNFYGRRKFWQSK